MPECDNNEPEYPLFLVFMPVAILAWVLSLGPVLVFILAMIGIIPLASLLAESTEVLAYKTGPKIGSLLNATFGNAVDLILLFALLRSGQMEIVKASIVGSILTTLLLWAADHLPVPSAAERKEGSGIGSDCCRR